jgi:hypothetical protein
VCCPHRPPQPQRPNSAGGSAPEQPVALRAPSPGVYRFTRGTVKANSRGAGRSAGPLGLRPGLMVALPKRPGKGATQRARTGEALIGKLACVPFLYDVTVRIHTGNCPAPPSGRRGFRRRVGSLPPTTSSSLWPTWSREEHTPTPGPGAPATHPSLRCWSRGFAKPGQSCPWKRGVYGLALDCRTQKGYICTQDGYTGKQGTVQE